jgi:hypothetical protein
VDDHTWRIGIEAANLPTGFSSLDLPFLVPPWRVVERLQGFVSWTAACPGDGRVGYNAALSWVGFDGSRAYQNIVRSNVEPANEALDYKIHTSTGSGHGVVHLELLSQCPGSDWEIQALMRVE